MISLVLSGLLALAQAAPQGFGPNSNFPTNLVRDTATARQFAKTVTGPQDILKNWTGAHSVCEWEGFYCQVNPDTNLLSLAGIDFSEFELTGDVKLTGFLEKFPDLTIFHARSNHFKGSVPNIRSQKYLFELDLANNDLSGEFPGNVFEANLTFLDLRFNQFSGKIPAKLFTTYPAIELIGLNDNQFSGEIPPTIGASPVKYLVLANNKLTGAIPAGLANAPKLEQILLLGNQLTGSIPKGLGAIRTLEIFDASNNKLTGPVPEDLCASKSITSIVLTNNNLDKKLGPKCQQAKAKGILKL